MELTAEKRQEPSLAFGGQAVIEGVMIRSKKHVVNGEISTKTEEINSISERYKVLRLPLIRGLVALVESVYLGVKGLYFSANVSLEEEDEKIEPKEMAVTFVLAIALAIILFSITPFFLTSLLTPFSGVIFVVIEGIIRIQPTLQYLLLTAI